MTQEALKRALEALELHGQQYPHMVKGYCLDAITAIKEALAQEQEQEPVAWGVDWGNAGDIPCVSIIKRLPDGGIKVLAVEYAPYSYTTSPKQEPVAWLITDEKINSLQVDSIQRLIDRARHAHMTDIKLRINGQDEWYQADWLKHLIRATPPQRTWVGLTDENLRKLADEHLFYQPEGYEVSGVFAFARAIEAKIKQKNGYAEEKNT